MRALAPGFVPRLPADGFRRPGAAQTAARSRNFGVFRLRGLYAAAQAGFLTADESREIRIVDGALARLGAEPESARRARGA